MNECGPGSLVYSLLNFKRWFNWDERRSEDSPHHVCVLHHIAWIRLVGWIPTSCQECKCLSASFQSRARGRCQEFVTFSIHYAKPLTRYFGSGTNTHNCTCVLQIQNSSITLFREQIFRLLSNWEKGNTEKARESRDSNCFWNSIHSGLLISEALQVPEILGLPVPKTFEGFVMLIGLVLCSFAYVWDSAFSDLVS